MSKEYFDLILFAPLETESDAVFETFAPIQKRTSDNILKYTIDLGVAGLTGLLAQPPEWGNQEALKTAIHLLQHYDAGLIICIGIAGALSSDLKLGDVCYSGTIFDVNERLKVKDIKSKGSKSSKGYVLEHTPKSLETPRTVTVALNHLRADPELKKTLYAPWRAQRKAYVDGLVKAGKLTEAQRESLPEEPSAIGGAIICGPVVASDSYSDVLKGLDRKILAVETESGGIFQAAQDANADALAIRGISDLADTQKGTLEEETGGTIRELASRNAVAFLKAQLNNPEFLAILQRKREQHSGAQIPGLLQVVGQIIGVPSALADLEKEIDFKLKELCPEFPLTKKGYRLPSPRVKAMRLEDDPRAVKNDQYVDLIDAISASQIIFVDIPRNYPDLALPWVWADTLSSTLIGDKQVVPIVLDADAIAPPKTIEEAAAPIARDLRDIEGAELVFIVPNVNASSRSRATHLAEQIKNHPNSRFILITRGEGALLLQREILRKINGRPYSLGEVSFLSISEFIQAAFDVEATEAEIIALKLRETFSKFKLSAHPTFFAGIPQPMMSSLLQANRRAELIQLAVDGYLTLIATQDEEKNHLNRSTRARYLSRLAVALDVEKLSFSQAGLIQFTRRFAVEFDFDDLDPLSFIGSFVQKGILQFENSNVEFTLPFVRSYLLASALRDEPALAKRYFDFPSDDFDFETFDLYSELGPSEEIVSAVEERLKRDLETLRTTGDNVEFLFSNDLRPALLEKGERLGEIRATIQRNIETLQNRSEDGRGKQRLLDIADNTNAEVEQKVGDIGTPETTERKAHDNLSSAEFDGLLRNWRIANVLLGAAAQRLEGTTKQRLASLLAIGGAAIADRLTRLYAKVDYHEIKATALASTEVRDFLSSYSTGMDEEQLKQLVGYVIDFVELYVLALPFRSIITDLCDQSSDKVLAGSVDRAAVPEGVAALLRAAWLADLDSRKAMPKLRDELASMPLAPFLRIVLAQHFLNRVYWRHWKDVDRTTLLDAAAEVVKVFGSLADKGKLERLIGQTSDTDRVKKEDR